MLPDNRALIRALLVAGLVAGLVTAAFHLTVSERYVDRAIELEEAAQQRELDATGATEERHEAVFSRRTQKVGLLAGTIVYAVAAGAVFAGLFALVGSRLPGHTRRGQVGFLLAAVVIAAALIPFLKYPANPPGVGDPGTLGRRQLLYIGCLLLSIAGLWLAARLHAWLRTRTDSSAAFAGAVAFFLAWAGLLLVLLPGRADPVHTPTRLLWEFRAASLAGQLLFWTVFGTLFAVMLERGERESPAVTALR